MFWCNPKGVPKSLFSDSDYFFPTAAVEMRDEEREKMKIQYWTASNNIAKLKQKPNHTKQLENIEGSRHVNKYAYLNTNCLWMWYKLKRLNGFAGIRSSLISSEYVPTVCDVRVYKQLGTNFTVCIMFEVGFSHFSWKRWRICWERKFHVFALCPPG